MMLSRESSQRRVCGLLKIGWLRWSKVIRLDKNTGLCEGATYTPSPNCDERECHTEPEVIILHSISLPPGEDGHDFVSELFCNRLDPDDHSYFAHIAHLQVSSHFYIRRSGELIQFVPTHMRAWHAGESVCRGKPKVNDFSLGVELEGLDIGSDGFSDAQYLTLNSLLEALREAYPLVGREAIFAHSDIAPGRKLDPGPMFDWSRVF